MYLVIFNPFVFKLLLVQNDTILIPPPYHMKTESIFTQLHKRFLHTEHCNRVYRRTLFVQHPFIPWTHFCDRQHDIQLSTFQSFAFKISSPHKSTFPQQTAFHPPPSYFKCVSFQLKSHPVLLRDIYFFCLASHFFTLTFYTIVYVGYDFLFQRIAKIVHSRGKAFRPQVATPMPIHLNVLKPFQIAFQPVFEIQCGNWNTTLPQN